MTPPAPKRHRGRPRRNEQPAFRDGFVLGSLWAAENTLVRLLAGHRPEAEHITAAFREITEAIKIVRKRVETKP